MFQYKNIQHLWTNACIAPDMYDRLFLFVSVSLYKRYNLWYEERTPSTLQTFATKGLLLRHSFFHKPLLQGREGCE